MSIPQGTVSDRTYLVQMSEDAWLGFDKIRKLSAERFWIGEAETAKVVHVVLKLFPHDIFRATEHTSPYVAWRHRIPQPEDKPYKIACALTIMVDGQSEDLSVPLRRELELLIRTYPKGTDYKVCNGDGYGLFWGIVGA